MLNPPLFCKPFTKRIVFSRADISFRSLILKKDLKTIHGWVNSDYAKDYWQLNGSFSMLWSLYQCMEENPYSASFVAEAAGHGLLAAGLVCQFDVYSVCADELKDHVEVEEHDCGFHLLMAPCEKPIPGLTVKIIKTFLDYYFSFAQAKRMYAEPDVRNAKSIALLEKCGFVRVKTVQMSYKVAHVYCYEVPR